LGQSSLEVEIELRKKAHRADILLPKAAPAPLQIFKLLGGQSLVKVCNSLTGTVDLVLIDPYAMILPVHQEVIGKDAVRVDEYGDARFSTRTRSSSSSAARVRSSSRALSGGPRMQ
jgi:hypothetical protein